MAKASAPVVLRLDRSKKYSTVHGDRGPGDPHIGVMYIQDSLPYDSEGILVADDGRTDPLDTIENGQRIRFWPLYNAEMRAKVKHKLERAAKGQTVDEPVSEHDDDAAKEDASEDVNLESWLRGEAKYQSFLIFAACKRRFSKSYTRLRDVVDDLVNEERLIPETEVDKTLLKMISERAA